MAQLQSVKISKFKEDVKSWKEWTPLPANGRVAILIRGQAFRGDHSSDCNEDKRDDQLSTTALLVSNVVKPLEQRGNRVDITVGVDPKCEMMAEIVDLLGSHRIIATPSTRSANQLQSIRNVLEGFKSAIGGVDFASNYDLIFVVRHDDVWKKTITAFHADYSQLNFVSWCEARVPASEHCLNDVAQVMPGRIWRVFDARVGFPDSRLHGCFPMDERIICHWSYKMFNEELQKANETARVGVLLDWRPQENIRDTSNPYFEVMPFQD